MRTSAICISSRGVCVITLHKVDETAIRGTEERNLEFPDAVLCIAYRSPFPRRVLC